MFKMNTENMIVTANCFQVLFVSKAVKLFWQTKQDYTRVRYLTTNYKQLNYHVYLHVKLECNIKLLVQKQA